jgi:hypothetical protein
MTAASIISNSTKTIQYNTLQFLPIAVMRACRICTPWSLAVPVTRHAALFACTAYKAKDGSFEAVVCNFGLGHFPRAEYAMVEAVLH